MDRENQSPSNVIKRGAETNGFRGVIKKQTLTARRDAEDIISVARLEAEVILKHAVQEADGIRDEAYREGMEQSLTEFETHLLEIREMRSNVIQNAEHDLLALAVRIAEKILGSELTANKKAVSEIVSTALRNARQREKVTVFVNPSDLDTISRESERFASESKIRLLDFVADREVPAGGCIIETEVGKIDARLDTQLKVIENLLLSQADDASAL